MNFSPSAWGLDLTDGALKAVRLTRTRGRLIVKEAIQIVYSGPGESIGRPRNGLGDGEREGLLTFLRDHQPGASDRVVLGFPASGSLQKIVSLPPVRSDHLHEAARFEAESLLGDEAPKHRIRHRILRGRTEADVPALLVAVREERLSGIVRDLDRVGLAYDAMELEPLAAAHYLQFDQALIPPYLAVQIGRYRSDLIFGTEKGVWTRSLPFGVGQLLGLPKPDPTRTREYGRRIALETIRAVAWCFGSEKAWRPKSLVLLGDGADAPGLEQTLSYFLWKTPTTTLRSLQRIEVASKVDARLVSSLPRWGTALGLALSGLREQHLSLSLIPKNRDRDARRLAPGVGIAAVLASTILIGLTFLAQSRERDVLAIELPPSDRAPDAMIARFRTLQDNYRQIAAPVRRLGRWPTERALWAEGIQDLISRFPDPGQPGVGVSHLSEVRLARKTREDTLLEARIIVGGGKTEEWVRYFVEMAREIAAFARPEVEVTVPGASEDDSGECVLRAHLRSLR